MGNTPGASRPATGGSLVPPGGKLLVQAPGLVPPAGLVTMVAAGSGRGPSEDEPIDAYATHRFGVNSDSAGIGTRPRLALAS